VGAAVSTDLPIVQGTGRYGSEVAAIDSYNTTEFPQMRHLAAFKIRLAINYDE
jgi:hypothetical protein